jgi:hypothetical protein
MKADDMVFREIGKIDEFKADTDRRFSGLGYRGTCLQVVETLK